MELLNLTFENGPRAIPIKIETSDSILMGETALRINLLEQLYPLNWIATRFQLSECCASVVDLKLLLLIAADTYSNFKSKTTLESYIC